MFTRGYAKHPCTQHVYSQGFAVARARPYGRVGRTANPSVCNFHTHGFEHEPL